MPTMFFSRAVTIHNQLNASSATEKAVLISWTKPSERCRTQNYQWCMRRGAELPLLHPSVCRDAFVSLSIAYINSCVVAVGREGGFTYQISANISIPSVLSFSPPSHPPSPSTPPAACR